MDRDVELIDIIIVFGGTIVFLYFFFFVPPTVEIIEYTRNAKRLTYSAVVLIAPLVVMLWILLLVTTDCGKKRIRDFKIRKKISIFLIDLRVKLSDGVKEYYSWRKKNRKH